MFNSLPRRERVASHLRRRGNQQTDSDRQFRRGRRRDGGRGRGMVQVPIDRERVHDKQCTPFPSSLAIESSTFP